MRILAAVRHSSNPKFYYGGLWSGNFYPALRQIGHEIIESQVDLFRASCFMEVAQGFSREQSEIRAQITEQLIDEVTRAHKDKPIDLFLSYFYNSHFDPIAFTEIKRLGIPTINFFCNSMYQFPLVADIARNVDFSWHTERDARTHYLGVGANPVYVQMGADPDVYHPANGLTREPKACFVGQRYCDRDRWLAELVRQNIPVDIYGNGWLADEPQTQRNDVADHRGKPRPGSKQAYLGVARENVKDNGLLGGVARTIRQAIYAQQSKSLRSLLQPHAKGKAGALATVFGQYELVLNFSNVWADGRTGSALIPHVRLRDFEAPMCRSSYLTGHSDEIEQFYEVGSEIDTYRSETELVDKSRFYLRNPAAAEKLRESGYQRARRDHTWVKRFEELFSLAGVPARGSV